MAASKVIKSINFNQHEILNDIIRLHNDGQPFDCDLTYSKGNFYGEHKLNDESIIDIPQPLHKFDVNPQCDDVVQIDPNGKVPLDDESINSVCIDLPFLLGIGPSLKTEQESNNVMQRRFAYYPSLEDLFESYKHWIDEAYRILKKDGICVFKCQNVITGGKFLDTPFYSKFIAESVGFEVVDEFLLLAKQRLISGKIKKQQHARSFHSYFIVFKKSQKHKISFFGWMEDDDLKSMLEGVKNHNNKKRRRRK